MKAKRIILLTVIFFVLLVVAGGIFLYIRRNRGIKLLARAEVALKAGNFDKAASLSRRYTRQKPQDWRGHHFLGQAQLQLAKYEEARAPLKEAVKLAPTSEVAPLLGLADTYAWPAASALAKVTHETRSEKIRKAIEQFEQANKILTEAKVTEGKPFLVVMQHVGLNCQTISRAWRHLSSEPAEEARDAEERKLEAEKAGTKIEAKRLADLAKEKRLVSARYLAAADGAARKGIQALLKVIRQDATLRQSARALVELCIEQDDKASLDEMREAIQAISPPNRRPPIAAMRLAHYDLRTRAKTESPKKWRAQLDDFCELLDGLLADNPKEAEIQLVRAEVALMLGDRERARTLCRQVLGADPRNRHGRLIKAKILMHGGRHNEAMAILLGLTTEFRGWAEAHYIYGQAAQTTGKTGLARQEMRLVTELDPGHSGARRFLAASLLAGEFFDQALTDAQQFYKAHPDDPDAVRLVAEAAWRTKQPELAVRILADAERRNGTSPRMMLSISDAYRILKMDDKAADALKKAADAEPQSPADHLAKARAMLRTNRASEAEKVLLDELDRSGDQAELCYELGELYYRSRRVLQAIDQFKTAVRLNGQDRRYRLALARALLNSGNPDSAAAALDSVSANDPDVSLLRLQIGLARGDQGKDVSADKMLAQLGGNARAGRALALAYYAGGKMDECVKACLAELKKTPDAHDVRLLLGQAYLALDKPEDSLKQWSTVLKAMPGQEPVYQRIAVILSGSGRRKPDEVAALMAKLPGAEPEMIDLTTGWLYQRAGGFKSAIAAYDRMLAREKVPQHYQIRARTRRASALAASGQVDQAVAALDAMAQDPKRAVQARQAKVNILIRARRKKDALAALGQLRKTVAEKNENIALLRIAELYARLGSLDEALALCAEVKRALPRDARPHLLQARILAAAGRQAQAMAPLHQAISLQPGNLDARVALARAMNALHRPRAALDTLRRLEKTGQAGRVKSLYEQGRLFATLGLSAQAAEAMSTLADIADTSIPEIQLALGRALAALGKRQAARESLQNISVHSPQYIQARQLLAGIAPDVERKLAILAELAKAKPGHTGVLAQQMDTLIGADRSKEALAVFQAFIDAKTITDRSGLARADFLAYVAMLKVNDAKSAAHYALEVAKRTNQARWRQLAVLVAIDADPPLAARVMAAAQRADLNDAYLALVLAVARKELVQADTWADRAEGIVGQLASGKPPRRVSPRHRLLAALAVRRGAQARTVLSAFSTAGAIDRSAAIELVNNAAGDAGAALEAARLLRATLAVDFGLRELGRTWAMKVLSSRPRCQWAAALAFQTNPATDTCRVILAKLNPKDCTAARIIQARLHERDGQFDRAAEIYGALIEKNPGDAGLQLSRAGALERGGHLEKSLELYQQIQRDKPNLIAANNGAYLISQLYPKDKTRVAQALEWMNETVKTRPGVAAFRETRGWLAYLMGEKDQARADIRQAIKGLKNSTDGHYHLGVIEADAGDLEMARWNYRAAVSSIAAIESGGRKPSVSERKVAGLAVEALAELDKNGTPQP